MQPPPALFTLDLAGIHVELRCADEDWRTLAEERWGGFTTGQPADLSLDYEVVSVPPVSLSTPTTESPLVRFHGGVGRVASPPMEGEIDLVERRGALRGPRETFPVDVVLREILPIVLPDTLFLHASAVCRDASAWVGSGASGSGKSTLAALSGGRALSDELSAVRETGGVFEAVGIPFWTGRPGAVPLRAVLLLEHGREKHEAIRLSPAGAMRGLVPHVVWPVEDAAATARTFAVLTGLCDRVPAYRFAFLPRPDVWDFVSEVCL